MHNGWRGTKRDQKKKKSQIDASYLLNLLCIGSRVAKKSTFYRVNHSLFLPSFFGSHSFPLAHLRFSHTPLLVLVFGTLTRLFSFTSQKAFLRPQRISKNRVVSFHNGQMNEKKRIRNFSRNSAINVSFELGTWMFKTSQGRANGRRQCGNDGLSNSFDKNWPSYRLIFHTTWVFDGVTSIAKNDA